MIAPGDHDAHGDHDALDALDDPGDRRRDTAGQTSRTGPAPASAAPSGNGNVSTHGMSKIVPRVFRRAAGGLSDSIPNVSTFQEDA
ncbi:hypothetical protein [Streptomyces sp. NPDC052701]|uniref:hypothetical protein n=1 Tax=Streptomyces sp. NPDC052701 TaxID=3155533 RepID=UPI00343A0AA7